MAEELHITPEEEERIINSYRCSGEMICEKCGKNYYRHPMYEPSGRASYDGHPFLHEICNGDLVKL